MLSLTTFALLVALPAIATAAVPTKWRVQKLHIDQACGGEAYETFEEPFDTCLQYYETNMTKPYSQIYKTATDTSFKHCIYTDDACTAEELCQDVPLQCTRKDFSAMHTAYITNSIGEQENLGEPAEYALFTYFRYGDVGCKADMETMNERLEIPKGRCIKFTDFAQWNDKRLRFCTYNDPQCGDEYPQNCHIVSVEPGCVDTGNGESYNATIRFTATQGPQAAATDSANTLSLAIVAFFAAIFATLV